MSIVTQAITIRHPATLSPATITSSIDDAGFDIVSTPAGDVHRPSLSSSLSKINPLSSSRRSKHIQQCTHCLSNAGSRDKLGEDTLISAYPELTRAPSRPNSTLSEKEDVDIDEKPSAPAPTLAGPYQVLLSVGGMTCASCSSTITESLSALPGVHDVAVNLLGNSASVVVDDRDRVAAVVTAIEDAGYEAEVITVASSRPAAPLKQPDGPYRVGLSVGGMTCVSCVNTVTALAEDIPGINNVAVSLIGKSATATIVRQELAEQLVTAIEDAGYEAEITTMEPLFDGDTDVSGPRTIQLRVEGMFCP